MSADSQSILGDQGLPGVKPDSFAINQVVFGSLGLSVNQDKHIETKVSVKQVMGLDRHKKRFDWQRKRRFLRIAKIYWPNVTLCCAMAGIHPSSYYLHLKIDKIFYQKVQQIDQGTTDRIEGVMASEAINPKSFLDRMAYLRAHRPELYNPARKIIVEGYKMSAEESAKRSAILGEAVEAQIVSGYTTRKERAQAKREGSSLLPSGEQGEQGGKA